MIPGPAYQRVPRLAAPEPFITTSAGLPSTGEGSSSITVDHRRLQGEAHRAHLLLGLAGPGLRAVEVHDRAVHIEITASRLRKGRRLIS
jgi:hypothetical protein